MRIPDKRRATGGREPAEDPGGHAHAEESRGPYDPGPADDDAAWFLPPLDAAPDPATWPGRTGDRQALFDAAVWRAAQMDLCVELADLSFRLGTLDERLRTGPASWVQRLALMEVAELGWWTGDRIAAERLVLWTGLHLSGVQDDAPALTRAGWAVRRLAGGPGPGDSAPTLAAFLGRRAATAAAYPDGAEDAADALAGMTGLHDLTRAAALFHLWRSLGDGGAGRDIEAVVLAARIGAAGCRGGAVFLPLAFAGGSGLRATGSAGDRLAAWISGADQSILAMLLHLDRLQGWARRAQEQTSDLTGRTPAMLIRLLAEYPAVTAPMAKAHCPASRASIVRNLNLMQDREVIREITGQGRYRVWTARI